MISGRTRSIIRAAPSATTTIPATTISARSVIADATARPCGTASSPLSVAGRCARPFDGRAVCSGRRGHLAPGVPGSAGRANARRYRGARMPALIFDLDGTLVDTVYGHVFAWQRALAQCDMPIDGWRIHRRVGMSGGLFTRAVAREIGRELTDQEAEDVQRLHGELFRELLPGAPAVAGRTRPARRPAGALGHARDRHLGPAAGDRRIAGRARRAGRHGGRRARRRRAREARARPVRRVRAAPRCRAGDVLRGRRRGLGPPRRPPRGHALVGLLSGGYGSDELERAGAYRVYRDAAELHVSLDELGVG